MTCLSVITVIFVVFVLISSSSERLAPQQQKGADRSQLDVGKSKDWSSRALGPEDGGIIGNRQHVNPWDEPDRLSKAREDLDTEWAKIVKKVLGSSRTQSETVIVEGDDEDQRNMDINDGLEPEEPSYEPEEPLDPRARSGVASFKKKHTEPRNSTRRQPQGALCWIPRYYKPFLLPLVFLLIFCEAVGIWLLIRRYRVSPKFRHLTFGRIKSASDIVLTIKSLSKEDFTRLSEKMFYRLSNMKTELKKLRRYYVTEQECNAGRLNKDVLVADLRGRPRIWRREKDRSSTPYMKFESVEYPSHMDFGDESDDEFDDEFDDDGGEEEPGRARSGSVRKSGVKVTEENNGQRNSDGGGMFAKYIFHTPPPPPPKQNI